MPQSFRRRSVGGLFQIFRHCLRSVQRRPGKGFCIQFRAFRQSSFGKVQRLPHSSAPRCDPDIRRRYRKGRVISQDFILRRFPGPVCLLQRGRSSMISQSCPSPVWRRVSEASAPAFAISVGRPVKSLSLAAFSTTSASTRLLSQKGGFCPSLFLYRPA